MVEETVVPGENHSPAASYWQSLSHNVASGQYLAFGTITSIIHERIEFSFWNWYLSNIYVKYSFFGNCCNKY